MFQYFPFLHLIHLPAQEVPQLGTDHFVHSLTAVAVPLTSIGRRRCTRFRAIRLRLCRFSHSYAGRWEIGLFVNRLNRPLKAAKQTFGSN